MRLALICQILCTFFHSDANHRRRNVPSLLKGHCEAAVRCPATALGDFPHTHLGGLKQAQGHLKPRVAYQCGQCLLAVLQASTQAGFAHVESVGDSGHIPVGARALADHALDALGPAQFLGWCKAPALFGQHQQYFEAAMAQQGGRWVVRFGQRTL